MSELIEITVDEQPVTAERNIPLLPVLNEQKIIIPSLCYHALLEPYGGCGLCMVEIDRNSAWKSQRACLLKTEEGLKIRTASARLRWLRSQAARLLLMRSPFNKKSVESFLIELIQAGEGLKSSRIHESLKCRHAADARLVNSGCLLCGLCIRICGKVGKNQLTFLGRGENMRVGRAAYKDEPGACGRCRACSHICPTGFITPDVRRVFTANLYKDKETR